MKASEANYRSIGWNWELLNNCIKSAIIEAIQKGSFECLVPICKIDVPLESKRLRVLGYGVSNFRDENASYGCKECILISWSNV